MVRAFVGDSTITKFFATRQFLRARSALVVTSTVESVHFGWGTPPRPRAYKTGPGGHPPDPRQGSAPSPPPNGPSGGHIPGAQGRVPAVPRRPARDVSSPHGSAGRYLNQG